MSSHEIVPWEQPFLPELAEPVNLAEQFNSLRHYIGRFEGDRFAHITDGDIEHLIKLCYYASNLPEEGRFPRFRLILYAYGQPDDFLRTIITFQPSIPLNQVKDIHRLAPAVASLDYALRVIKVGDRLHCDAVILVNDSEILTRVGNDLFDNTMLMGIMVRVDAPGDILISYKGLRFFNFRLRAAKIEGGQSFSGIELVKDWQRALSQYLANHCIADVLEKSPNPSLPMHAKIGIEYVIKSVWGKLLQKVIDARHGGAFLILPRELKGNVKEIVKNEYKVDLKYPIGNLDLSSPVLNFWRACDNDLIKEAETPEFDPQLWHEERHILQSKIDGLANLANVDGCVVLDRLLNVLGFGGEILTSGEEADNSPLIYSEYGFFPRDRTPIDEEEIKQFGTRNRSAFRFCKVNPGAIAFVISQDGDLRVFASDGTGVFLFRNITAWTSERDAM